MLVAFFDAQHINFHSGGAVIAPWDFLEGYSLLEWAEAAHMLSQVRKIRRRNDAQRQVFEKVRKAHKQYARVHYGKVN